MWSKVLPHVKQNPYIINQNHIFSKNYCEVISGYILTNFTPKHSELSIKSFYLLSSNVWFSDAPEKDKEINM
jgi:hypothetical protein